jgi:acyl-CoA-binding protein
MSAASTDGSGTEVALANMTKGGVKVDINEVIERRWEERAKQQEEVRRRMRTGWKTDPSMLDEYFKSVVTNWKSYRGPKTEKIVCKMYGIYKQAVVGDCTTSNTHDLLSLPSKKWEQWNCRKGMSKEDSKRRFITFCAEIDPMLIDIMPNEMPPDGFPCDNKGIPICAKCNTVVGCSRPLLDEHFQNLRRQLFEQPELQKPNNLRSWMANALKNQRCMWGVHKPVNLVDAKKFSEWFNRTENRGYHMYDSKNLMLMVRDLLCLLYEILVDMQKNKDVHTIEEVNAQIMKVYALDKYYFEFTGDKYVYETECTRDEEICNKRREGDGGRNHKHPVEIEPPEVDYSPFDEAIALRKKCQELGINPATGIQIDVEKRSIIIYIVYRCFLLHLIIQKLSIYDIFIFVFQCLGRCERYREKIKEYEMAQEAIVAARKRNEMRSAQLPISKVKIKNISADLLIKHMVNACNENDKLKILSLGERGCTCNVETPRGMRPLTVIQIQSPTNAEFAKLLACRGADVNSVNKYGMSALMLACRMKDTKTILYYCDTAGADEAVSGGIRGKGRTALHYCAIHSSEEAAKLIYDQVEKANDVMRSIKFIDAQDANGDTALITAGEHIPTY